MRVLESFLINLGLKVDSKSFQSGQTAFDGLTKSALQLGAVFAGKLAIDKVVGNFRDAGAQLDNFNKLTGMSVEGVQKLGFALKQQGGNADDAFNALKNIQNLMASPLTGNTGWIGDAAKFGFDPNVVLNAKSTEEAVTGIAEQFEKMSTIQRTQVGKALGLSDAEVRVYSEGAQALKDYRTEAERYGVISKAQSEDAKKFDQSLKGLDQTFDSIGNTIGAKLTPALTEMVEEFTDFYKDNKELIDSGLDTFFGAVADNLKIISATLLIIGGSSGLKALAAVRGLVMGAGAAGGAGVAVAGAGASGLAIAGGGIGAALWSSSLNSGEDEILRQRRQGQDASPFAPKIIDYFMSKGWTREQAAGIAANLEQESNFDETASGDGGKAYGVAQWHPDRQANFKKWAGKDIRQSTLEDQLGFVNYELTQGAESSAGDKLRGATNAFDAGSIVSRYYERPKNTEDEANFRGDRAANYPGVGGGKGGNTFIFNGADEGTVRKVIREEVGDMAGQTMNDMTSSEK